VPGPFPWEFLARVTSALEAQHDPVRAAAMAKYMKGHFAYAGVPAPAVGLIFREAVQRLAPPTQGDLGIVVGHLWERPEREYQYLGCSLLARNVKRCDASLLAVVHTAVTTKSWWDTVDSLAANVAGPLVQAHPELVDVMDRWVVSDNMWLARTAILHQLRFRARTDEERLFRYCLARAGDREFFIRKAIGWALREYSKQAPQAVVAFVNENAGAFSPLSQREALKWLAVRASGRRLAEAEGLAEALSPPVA